MKFTDTHCHLYTEEFHKDRAAMLKRAENENVEKFYLHAIDSESTDALLNLEAQYPGQCFAMMGLHPCYVKENYEEELRNVETWLAKRKFAAIGEIGLDFYWDTSFTTQQYHAFTGWVECGQGNPFTSPYKLKKHIAYYRSWKNAR